MEKTIKFSFNITYEDVKRFDFTVDESILDKSKDVYAVENEMITNFLQNLHLTIRDVTACTYSSGMFKPFGAPNMQITMATNYYTVYITANNPEYSRLTEKTITTASTKQEILNLFLYNYKLPASKSKLLKLYRDLALKHHPDKGGNEEIMKYINELKNRYIR